MTKKFVILLFFILSFVGLSAQSAYSAPNFRSGDRDTSTDMTAIAIDKISPIEGDENGYLIDFRDTQNVRRAVEAYATSFKYYLSYKGQRVSDYKIANSNYKYTFTDKCYAWPGSVPKGDEKYVTVQIGEEPRTNNSGTRDRRDDSGAAVY